MQSINGITHVERTSTHAKRDNGTYVTVNEFYKPLSGYLALNTRFNLNHDFTFSIEN